MSSAVVIIESAPCLTGNRCSKPRLKDTGILKNFIIRAISFTFEQFSKPQFTSPKRKQPIAGRFGIPNSWRCLEPIVRPVLFLSIGCTCPYASEGSHKQLHLPPPRQESSSGAMEFIGKAFVEGLPCRFRNCINMSHVDIARHTA
jgi:hypothetical protein